MVEYAADKPSTAAEPRSAKIPVILQVVTRLDGGQAARSAIDTAIAVSRAGGKAMVASSGGNLQHELDRAGIAHIKLPVENDRDFTGLAIARRLRRLIEQEDIHIVHAHNWGPASAAKRATRGLPVKPISSYLESIEPLSFFQRRRLRSLARSERVVAPTQITASYLRTEFKLDPGRIATIAPGINLARFSPAAVRAERIIRLAQQWRVPDDRRIVLVATPLESDRGHTQVIEAIGQMQRTDVFCLMLGAKPENRHRREELEKLIARRKVDGLVFIADQCNDMSAAYMLADSVVVMEQQARPYSRVVIEAQAMGRPVIASSAGGVAEPLLVGQTGWVVPPSDTAALAKALQETLSLDAAQRARLAHQATEHVRNNFTVEAAGEQILALYDGLLETAWSEAHV